MSMENEYENAKRTLAQLKQEQIEIPLLLSSALRDGEAAEIARLQRRKVALPSEILTTQILVCRADVARLKAELAAAHNRVDQAKAKSKVTDERTASALKVLDEERQRINQESFADFVEIHESQNHLTKVIAKLREAEAALNNLISEAA
jgi:outer membrane protein TolC